MILYENSYLEIRFITWRNRWYRIGSNIVFCFYLLLTLLMVFEVLINVTKSLSPPALCFLHKSHFTFLTNKSQIYSIFLWLFAQRPRVHTPTRICFSCDSSSSIRRLPLQSKSTATLIVKDCLQKGLSWNVLEAFLNWVYF